MEQLKHFRRRLSSDKGRHHYDITPTEPSFSVRYLGMSYVTENSESPNWHKLESQHVEILQQDCKAGRKSLRKVNLVVSTNIERGLTVIDVITKAELSLQLHNIAYCCANKKDPKVFSFIVERDSQLQCHAFVTSKEAKARAICLALSKAFTTAYGIWLKQKRKQEGKKARIGRENSLDGTEEGIAKPDNRQCTSTSSAEFGKIGRAKHYSTQQSNKSHQVLGSRRGESFLMSLFTSCCRLAFVSIFYFF